MSRSHPNLLLAPLMFTVFAAIPIACHAQAHEQRSGDYVLRSSTVSSEMLAPQTAREHGVERGPATAVINVTVTKGASTVGADVSVTARNLDGRAQIIQVRKTQANGYISYIGTYRFVNGEVLDFTVQAQPQGTSTALSLRFRDRLWRIPSPAEGAR